MKILITGCCGFIGFNFSNYLCKKNKKFKIIGIDNLNNYYSVKFKKNRLKELKKNKNFSFNKVDLINYKNLKNLFIKNKFDCVLNLAAQPGVRYSLINPNSYVKNNISGFYNLFDLSSNYNVKKFLYASSSSVYGDAKKFPLKEKNILNPKNIYGYSKKINEELVGLQSSKSKMKTIGLRFFTIYGEWGRPDMMMLKYLAAQLNSKKFYLNNFGNHTRDFTYIDDIVEGVTRVIDNPAKSNVNWNGKDPDPGTSFAPWKVYNIGSNNPIKLNDYISEIEKNVGKKAKVNLLPLQPGDVVATYADVEDLFKTFDFKPKYNIHEGVKKFVEWFKKNPNF